MIQTYFQTIFQLLNQPRPVIDSFLKKGESKFTHPLIFVLIGAVFVTILNTILISFPTVASNTVSMNEAVQIELLSEWIDVISIRLSTQFFPLTLILLIPSLSLSGLFFFRNDTEGFYSQIIISSYAIGVSIPALLLAIPFWVLWEIPFSDPLMHTTIPAVLIVVIIFWIYKLYLNIPGFTGLLKNTSSLITGYLLFMLIKGLFASVTGYMLFAINRIRELSGT
jgi:hypothetical protein